MSVVWTVALAALGAFVHRRLLASLGSGTLHHLLRLPGNLLHEAAHAVATLLCGYTVSGFSVSLLDPAGRGGVRPGPPWTGLARRWLANLVAPVAPLAAGIVALATLAAWAGVPGLPTSASGVVAAAAAWPVDRWEAWAAVALALPVTAEACPSDVDMRAWLRPALVVGVLAAAAAWGAERLAPGSATGALAWADRAASGPVGAALALGVGSAIAWLPVAWVARWVRG